VRGFDYSKPPASPAPALKNGAYLGKYANDFFGDIAIVEKDGGLAIVEGPKKLTFPLKHYDRDTFTYDTTGENAVGRSGVTFTIGPDGQATQVVVKISMCTRRNFQARFNTGTHFTEYAPTASAILPISRRSALGARCISSAVARAARR
jgi:Domain of unknown function (DUF3471).